MRYYLLLGLIVLTLRVSASGMMLSANNNPLQFEDLHVDVSIDSDSHSVSMSLQATFSHEASSFVWLLPLPSPDAEISLSIPEEYQIRNFTRPELPPSLCSPLFFTGNQGSGGTPDSYPQAQTYEAFESADLLFAWLEAGNYSYPVEAESLIRSYFAAGHPVIALPFEQISQSGVGHIAPIRIQYYSEDLSFWLPLRLTAFSSTGVNYNYRMDWIEYHNLFPLSITVEADIQYAPMNVPHPRLEPEQIQFPNRIQAGQYSLDSGFIALWREALAANPEGFVTLAAERDETGRYITQLQAMIAPDAFLADPVFAPAPDLPDFRIADYYAGLDAFEFWGCATRNFVAELTYYERDYAAPQLLDFTVYEDLVADLPPNRMYFPQFGQSMAYPADWVHSSVEYPQYLQAYQQDYPFELEVFAPVAVDAEDINAYLRGEDSPAMIVLSRPYISEPNRDWSSQHYIELDSFKREYSRRPDFGSCCQSMLIDLLIGEEEWLANQAMYEAILSFPKTYAFSSHADLQHSLYISGESSPNYEVRIARFRIAYPAGWIEHYDESRNEIYFLPEGVQDRSQAVILSFYPEGFRRFRDTGDDADREAYLDEMTTLFNLLPEGRETLNQRILAQDCRSYYPPLALDANGRLGFLITEMMLTAAPNSPISDEQLGMMAESHSNYNYGCG